MWLSSLLVMAVVAVLFVFHVVEPAVMVVVVVGIGASWGVAIGVDMGFCCYHGGGGRRFRIGGGSSSGGGGRDDGGTD